jgi:hypothetical protein
MPRPQPQPVKPPEGQPILNRPPKPGTSLLPEWGPGLSVSDRRRNAVVNERDHPMAAIRARCVAAGYKLPEHDAANAA